jgi:hypothetical protein
MVELAPVPDVVRELLAPRAAVRRVPVPIRVHRNRYATVALERETERVATAPVGSRNWQLNRSSFNLGQLVCSGHLDADDVAGALCDAASRAGLPATEIQRTIASGMRAGIQKPRHVR